MTTIPIALEQPHSPRRRYGQRTVTWSAVDVLRRLLNITIALVGMVCAVPLLLLIALAVKLSSR